MHIKSILRTRTFWANVLGAAVQLANSGLVHAVDPSVLVLVQTGLNIAIRRVTDEPVTFLGR